MEPFLSLEHQLYAAVRRVDRRNANISNITAAQWLHARRQKKEDELREERTAVDHLVQASELKPRRFRTRYQAASFQGSTARQDAETSERNKWLDAFAELLLASSTPMGKTNFERIQRIEDNSGQVAELERYGHGFVPSANSCVGWLWHTNYRTLLRRCT